MLNPKDFLKDCTIKVWDENYSVYQTQTIPMNIDFVAIIKDHQEISVIALSGSLPNEVILKEEKDWKILTFEAVLPFELVGFMAVVAAAIAKIGASVFVLSAYSTDHVMVKTTHLETVLEELVKLGCKTG